MTTDDLSVGVDLVEVAGVARSVKRFGDRYLRRVFTEHEISCCPGPPQVAAASLAARFAAKEATLKVLRPEDVRPDWRSIEVVRLPTGACKLRLRGEAAKLAVKRGLGPFALSMTHEAGMAAAVVVSGSAVELGEQPTMEGGEP
ncbi:MAG: holo-ACP synthase [Acidimicrobiales bacterium]